MSQPEAVTGRSPFRLRRTAHKGVLTAHVLSSVGWFGVALAVVVAIVAASVTSDAALAHALRETLQYAPVVSVPLGLLAILTGGLLGLGTSYGLTRNWWVLIKIALAVAVVATDAVVVGAVAHDATTTATTPRVLAGSTSAHLAALAIATVLSVFKPRGRTPWTTNSKVRP